jgi:hypothetical protein
MHVKRSEFCEEVRLKMEEVDFAERLVFSDEAASHISGKVTRHNVRIWGTEQQLAQIDPQRVSLKVNVFCAVSREKTRCLIFFH